MYVGTFTLFAKFTKTPPTHLIANVLPHLFAFLLHFPVLFLAPVLGLLNGLLTLPLLLLCLFLVVAIIASITSYSACITDGNKGYPEILSCIYCEYLSRLWPLVRMKYFSEIQH